MLKAYAVALALTSTAPVATSAEVEAKQLDNQPQEAQVQKGFKRGGGFVIIPQQSLEVKKGFKRGGGFVIIPR